VRSGDVIDEAPPRDVIDTVCVYPRRCSNTEAACRTGRGIRADRGLPDRHHTDTLGSRCKDQQTRARWTAFIPSGQTWIAAVTMTTALMKGVILWNMADVQFIGFATTELNAPPAEAGGFARGDKCRPVGRADRLFGGGE
jgi:hypothetical protein